MTCCCVACRYLTPNDANPAPALIQSKTDFDPFNYYLLDPTFQVPTSPLAATRLASCLPAMQWH